MSKRLIVMLLLVMASAATAEAQLYPGDFERILIPVVATRSAGAFGSVWTTEFHARHEGNIEAVVGYDYGDDLIVIPPHRTYQPRLYARLAGEPEGALIYIRRTQTDTSHFSLRVRDESRNADSAGVAIPVVREHELLVGTDYLLGVPVDVRFRRMLRIYDPSGERSAFKLRVHDDGLQTLIATADIVLIPTTRMLAPTLPLRPAAIAIDLDQLVPDLGRYASVTLEIIPEDDARPWWGFVALTNNVSQEVTVVLP